MNSYLIDSHCHLIDDTFAADGAQAIQRAVQAGVKKFVTIATMQSEWEPICKYIEEHSDVFGTVGVHPHESIHITDASTFQSDLQLQARHPKMIGIGETGLDYHYNHSPTNIQQDAFRHHLHVARTLDLPVIIHTRNAEEDTIRLLDEFPGVRGLIHCFTGTSFLAEESLKRGLYISISGIVTFPKAIDIQSIVKDIPLDRLLIETDAPYLAPIPYRGKRNEPAFLIHTAQKIAELKGVSVQEIAHHTTENFYTLFRSINA